MMPRAGSPVKKAPARALSELEGAVLGLLHREGPLTAYSVRREFAASPTDHFSGSAGAIYPLMRRLEREGLIARSRTDEGLKGGTAFVPTPSGRAALRRWLLPADPAPMAGVTFDPLRTRVLSLGLLGPAERARFLESAERELVAHLRAQARRVAERGEVDPWVRAAERGVRETLGARLRWIRSLRRA